jgi:GTP-binding protein YchF
MRPKRQYITAMETAIIGLPLAGKTTFFNALTGVGFAPAGGRGRSFGVADVEVPDDRVDLLSTVFRPRKKSLAVVRFKDVQLELTPQGGIGSATMAELRSADALTLVVRAFEDDVVPHPGGPVDPGGDFGRLLDALMFSDFEVAQRRLERLEKEGRRGEREYQRLLKVRERLEEGGLLDGGFFSPEDERTFSGFGFLSAKPIVVVANMGERPAATSGLEQAVLRHGLVLFHIQGHAEMEIAQLPPEDQEEFLRHLGIDEPVKDRFLRTVYAQLNLISFLTAGEDEVRAWSIRRGTTAARAAGKIHSDLERGFIRAEVVEWDKLIALGGFKEAKRSGSMRLEGKEYLVRDGDVLTIRFNL